MRLNRSVCQNPVSLLLLFTIIHCELSQKNRKIIIVI